MVPICPLAYYKFSRQWKCFRAMFRESLYCFSTTILFNCCHYISLQYFALAEIFVKKSYYFHECLFYYCILTFLSGVFAGTQLWPFLIILLLCSIRLRQLIICLRHEYFSGWLSILWSINIKKSIHETLNI